MEIIEVIIFTLQIAAVVTKRHHQSSSAESIENLLYYKDCKHKQKEPPTEPPPPKETLNQRQSDCACPRMCISMCCDCGVPQSFVGRQMQPLQSQSSMIEPMQSPMTPPQRPPPFNVQPQIMQRGRKKKLKPKMGMESPMLLPPIGARRDFGGFTRQNIKSLISQDEDIKKILKDLVKVTMKKADLVDVVKKSKDQKDREQMAGSMRKQSFMRSEEDDDE